MVCPQTYFWSSETRGDVGELMSLCAARDGFPARIEAHPHLALGTLIFDWFNDRECEEKLPPLVMMEVGLSDTPTDCNDFVAVEQRWHVSDVAEQIIINVVRLLRLERVGI